MLEQRAVEPQQRRRSLDLELGERAEHARRARSRSTSWTISFAIIGSYRPLTSSPASTPESTRTPGPAGSEYAVIVPGAGRKPVRGSSALIRHSIAWPRRAISSCGQRERLAGGDEQLLPHEVEPRHGLGDRVLDLDPSVHLHEVEVPLRVEEALDRAGGAIPDGPCRVDGDRSDARAQLLVDRRRRASPRRASGDDAGSCSRARRDGRRCRARRRATWTSTCRGSRGTAPRRRSASAKCSRPRALLPRSARSSIVGPAHDLHALPPPPAAALTISG